MSITSTLQVELMPWHETVMSAFPAALVTIMPESLTSTTSALEVFHCTCIRFGSSKFPPSYTMENVICTVSLIVVVISLGQISKYVTLKSLLHETRIQKDKNITMALSIFFIWE